MKRNWRGTHDLVKQNHFDHKDEKDAINTLTTICQEMRKENKDSFYLLKMETKEVESFFPAKDNETIERFLQPDRDFPLRRRGFHELMKTVVTDTKKKFSDALLNTLFTIKYKQEHRWPSVG